MTKKTTIRVPDDDVIAHVTAQPDGWMLIGPSATDLEWSEAQLKRLTKTGRLIGGTLKLSGWSGPAPRWENDDGRYGGKPTLRDGSWWLVAAPGSTLGPFAAAAGL